MKLADTKKGDFYRMDGNVCVTSRVNESRGVNGKIDRSWAVHDCDIGCAARRLPVPEKHARKIEVEPLILIQAAEMPLFQ